MTPEDPVISKTNGVCGGRACIAGHRMPVWGVIAELRNGNTKLGILEGWSWMTSKQFDACLEYYAANKAEIEQDLFENDHYDEAMGLDNSPIPPAAN